MVSVACLPGTRVQLKLSQFKYLIFCLKSFDVHLGFVFLFSSLRYSNFVTQLKKLFSNIITSNCNELFSKVL